MRREAEPADALRSGSRTTTGGASLLQRGLVVVQAALSLVLLVGAGLFAQSLNKLESTDLKLDAKNRYIVHINPAAAGYPQTQLEALYRTIEERFHALPGVVKVGISSYTPMEDDNDGWSVQVQGQPDLQLSASDRAGECGVFRFGGNACGDGARHRRAGYADGADGGGGEPVVCEEALQAGREPDWAALRLEGRSRAGTLRLSGVVEDTAYTDVRMEGPRDVFHAADAAAGERHRSRLSRTMRCMRGDCAGDGAAR